MTFSLYHEETNLFRVISEHCQRSSKEDLKPTFQHSDFESLEPRLQRLLFEKLRSEVNLLRKANENSIYVKEHCPEADLQLYQKPVEYENYDRGLEHDEATEDEDLRGPQDDVIMENGGESRSNSDLNSIAEPSYFQEMWELSSWNPNLNPHGRVHLLAWTEEALSFSPLDANARFCFHPENLIPHDCKWIRFRDEEYGCQKGHSMNQRISPQLLLYRLIRIFGIPEEQFEDIPSEAIWMVSLEYDSDYGEGDGYLCFADIGGVPTIQFIGESFSSHHQALRLINYLCRAERAGS